ncbi:MAG: DUF1573 domain-containing protein [Planctomycetes bacterium]|nr:DUF1573 domain-containing protein [Planctomycetota bacterium]
MASGAVLLLALAWTVLPAAAQSNKPAAAGAKSPARGPRIQLSTAEWDFGSLWWGDACETEIEIANVGDAALEIKNVKTSCGCTAARPARNTLNPGERDRVRLSYDTQKGATQVYQTATFETNDPAQPAQVLVIRGEVRNLFDGEPSGQLAFGQICVNVPQTLSIELKNAYPQPLKLDLTPQPADSPYELRLDELERGRRYRLTATTGSKLKAGSNYTYVELHTDSPQHPKFKVVVSAFGMERIELMPPFVTVYSNQAPDAWKEPRQIRLFHLKDKPLTVRELRGSHPEIQAVVDPKPVQLAPDSPFDAITIKVSLPPFDKLPDERMTLEILTDDAEERFQKLTLPITREHIKPPQPDLPARPKSAVAPVQNGELPRAIPPTQPRKRP